jgi:uncharacterized protein with von Willebrand factor type A (vWA) domain
MFVVATLNSGATKTWGYAMTVELNGKNLTKTILALNIASLRRNARA